MKKDWRERELTMEVVVGAFIVMIFLGLGYFTIILSQDTWFSKTREMQVTFTHVMGLTSGDNVVARGMPVGSVKRLDLQDNCNGVLVTITLDEPLTFYEDYEVTIVSTSILGGNHLDIFEGSPHKNVVEPDILVGSTPYDLMADAAKIVNAVREGLIEGGIVENIKQASDQITEVIERIHSGQGNIGRLLSTDETMYKDATSTIASLRAIVEKVEAGESTLGKLLVTDSGVHDDLTDTVAAIKAMAMRLEKGKGTLGKLLSEDDQMYQDLSATAASLRRIADSIDSGEGLVGKLIHDDELYESLKAIVDETRAAIDDLRESSPVTTFTSVFFGAF